MQKWLSGLFTPKVRGAPGLLGFPDSPEANRTRREGREESYQPSTHEPFEIGEQLLIEHRRDQIDGGEDSQDEEEAEEKEEPAGEESAERRREEAANKREAKSLAKGLAAEEKRKNRRNVAHEDGLRERLRKIEKRLNGKSIPEVEKGCALFADLLLVSIRYVLKSLPFSKWLGHTWTFRYSCEYLSPVLALYAPHSQCHTNITIMLTMTFLRHTCSTNCSIPSKRGWRRKAFLGSTISRMCHLYWLCVIATAALFKKRRPD